jgi:galactonate dehydratase
MRIESVDVVYVGFEITGSQAYVQITTDSGIRGLGQSGGWGSAGAVGAIIEDFATLLIGADPFRIEHLWQLFWRVRPFRGNYLAAAVSAVDIALWDIKGKALGVPVWELLGGNTRDRLRLHLCLSTSDPDTLIVDARQAAEHGFTAIKFDPLGHDYGDLSMPALVERACSMGAAAREAVGQEVDIIFELHRKLDPARALVVANAITQFQPIFIEDPIQIDSIDAQAEISRRIGAPTATGERLSSLWEFRDLLSHNVAIHVRPDVGLAGGITGCRKIATIAEAHHCGMSPHNWLGPGLTAPTAHLCFSVPNLVTMEFTDADEDPGGSAQALTSSLVRTGGFMELPSAPGLGVELHPGYADIAPPAQKPLSAAGMLRRDGSVAMAV